MLSAYVAVDVIFQYIVLFVQLRQFNNHFASIKYKFLLILCWSWVGFMWSFCCEAVIKFPVLCSNARMPDLLSISLNLDIATKRKEEKNKHQNYDFSTFDEFMWNQYSKMFINSANCYQILEKFSSIRSIAYRKQIYLHRTDKRMI